MAKMLDHDGTPHDQPGLQSQQEARSPSGAEQAARAVIAQSCGRALTDGEWAKQRRRLIEFILTLARWDLESQLVEPKNIQPEASQQAVEDKEVCRTINRPD
jgi:hypothetical protein